MHNAFDVLIPQPVSFKCRRAMVFMAIFFGMAVHPTLASVADALTLKNCLSLAEQHSPELQAATEVMTAAYSSGIAARGDLFPRLDFSSGYTRQNPPLIPLGPPGTRPSAINKDVWQHGFTASQTLFASGRLRGAYDAARLSEKEAQENRKIARLTLSYDVKKAFYALLLAEQQVRIAQEAVTVAQSHAGLAQARLREGQGTSFEVSQRKVFWTNQQTAFLEAKNRQRIAEAALRRLIAWPAEQPLVVAGDLKQPARTFSLEPLRMELRQNRPELRALSYRAQRLEKTVAVGRSYLGPSLRASYSRLWESPQFSRSFDEYAYWDAGAHVDIPLFDGLGAWGRLRSAQADVRYVQSLHQSEEELATLALEEAMLRADDAQARIALQEQNVTTAGDNVRIAIRRERLGTLPFLELKDAQLSLTEAQGRYAQALYDYAISVAEIDHLIGRTE